MVRPLMFLSILLVGCLAASAAVAEIDLVYAERHVTATAYGGGTVTDSHEGLGAWDGDVSAGSPSTIRAYQSAVITNAGGHLLAVGSFGATVVLDASDPAAALTGISQCEIDFVVPSDATFTLRGTLAAGTMVELSPAPEGLDTRLIGPGAFDWTSALVPGRTYVFFVGAAASNGLGHDEPGGTPATVEFAVDLDPVVPVEPVAWGELHGAYR